MSLVWDVEFIVHHILDGHPFVQILECQTDYMVKEEIEECWSEDAALLNTVVDVEWC